METLTSQLALLQTASEHNTSLQMATKSVHEETNHIANNQMKEVSIKMQALVSSLGLDHRALNIMMFIGGIDANINAGSLSSTESAVSVSNTDVTGKIPLVALERGHEAASEEPQDACSHYIGRERKYYGSNLFSEHWLEKKPQDWVRSLMVCQMNTCDAIHLGAAQVCHCLNLGVCARVTLIKHPTSRHLAFGRSMLSPGVKEPLVDLNILHDVGDGMQTKIT